MSCCRLKCECRGHCIGSTAELGQQCVTPEFRDLTVIAQHDVPETSEALLDALVGNRLVALN